MVDNEVIRTVGVLTHANNILDAAAAMVDDCRFVHSGDGGRIGGEEEKELMNIYDEINRIQSKIRDFIEDYC